MSDSTLLLLHRTSMASSPPSSPPSSSSASSKFLPDNNNHPKQKRTPRRSRARRAFRMSRESEIPSLKAARFSLASSSSVPAPAPAPAQIVSETQKTTWFPPSEQNRSIIAALKPSHSSSSSSSSSASSESTSPSSLSRDGDEYLSDVDKERTPGLFHPRSWNCHSNADDGGEEELTSSSSSSSAAAAASSSSSHEDEVGKPGIQIHNSHYMGEMRRNHLMLDIGTGTSATSSVSSTVRDGDGDDVWELEAKIRNEECKLLRVQNELELLRWRNGLCDVKPDNSILPIGVEGGEIPEPYDEGVEFIRREYRSMLSGPDTFVSGHDSSPRALNEEISYKALIRQLVDQMQAEAEQWSQVQSVLRDVQEEMESLHEARISWEARAIRAESRVSSLKDTVHEWRCRARDAEERVSMLELERAAMKRKLRMARHRHVSERTGWLEFIEKMKENPTDTIGHSSPAESCRKKPSSICVVPEIDEKPRPASVGTREDYALCESIVHSRNESTRSSFDLGVAAMVSQRGFHHKMVKRSFEFSPSATNDGNSTSSCKSVVVRGHHPRLGEHLDFCSRSSDVNPMPTVQLTRLEMIEPVFSTSSPDKTKSVTKSVAKDVRRNSRFGSMGAENMVAEFSMGMRMIDDPQCVKSCGQRKMDGSAPSRAVNVRARVPFGEIVNNNPNPMHRVPTKKNRSF